MAAAAVLVDPKSALDPLESSTCLVAESPPILVLANSNKLSYMLRFGYWAEIELEDLKSIFEPLGFTVEVSEWEDDDCGWLYSYNITQPSLEEIQKQFQNK